MSYVCRCNNGHRPAASSGCDKANCHSCCKGKGGVNPDSSEWNRVVDNPASTNSYGFTKNYDGRIRGGIKTPPYGGVPSPTNPNSRQHHPWALIGVDNIRRTTVSGNCGCGSACEGVAESDCYKCCNNIRPYKKNNNNINNNNMRGYNLNPNRNGNSNRGFSSGQNVNPNRPSISNATKSSQKEWIISQGGTGIIERLHPLDIAGARRKIGKEYFDPISNKWKIDDGRPRGASWIPPNNQYPSGKWVWWCAGKCTSGRRWAGNKVKCPCDGQKDNCMCKGCHGGASC